MPTLVNLPDTKDSKECEFAYSKTEALRILRKGIAVLGSGDDGAIHIWKDDNGVLRGERHRFLSTVESMLFQNQKEATEWFGRRYKAIQGRTNDRQPNGIDSRLARSGREAEA